MNHYCEAMRSQVEHACADHPNPADCPDALVCCHAKSGRYGLRLHDGGDSSIMIGYCPWCGASLAAKPKKSSSTKG